MDLVDLKQVVEEQFRYVWDALNGDENETKDEGLAEEDEAIVNESVKYGRNSTGLITEMIKIFEYIWENETVPSQWLKSTITCLYKKGKLTQAQNYRAIAISCTLMRILPMIITKRLQDQYKYVVDPSQNGFIAGKSCDDAL